MVSFYVGWITLAKLRRMNFTDNDSEAGRPDPGWVTREAGNNFGRCLGGEADKTE